MKKSSKNETNVFAGRNLKYFIQNNGISEEQLARSFGIEKDSLQRILNGTNAISGPYNYILLNEYNCDLNFIYGGVAHCDVLVNDVQVETTKHMTMDEAISRELHYLADIIKDRDQLK